MGRRCGLWVLRRLLLRHFGEAVTSVTLISLLLGTNLYHYATFDSSYGTFGFDFAFAQDCRSPLQRPERAFLLVTAAAPAVVAVVVTFAAALSLPSSLITNRQSPTSDWGLEMD